MQSRGCCSPARLFGSDCRSNGRYDRPPPVWRTCHLHRRNPLVPYWSSVSFPAHPELPAASLPQPERRHDELKRHFNICEYDLSINRNEPLEMFWSAARFQHQPELWRGDQRLCFVVDRAPPPQTLLTAWPGEKQQQNV